MTPKLCRYQCGVMLDAWDDDAKKYREAGSGGLHTKERCEEMKAKARLQQGEKNHNHDDHGNETTTQPLRPPINTDEPVKPPYVDHTLAKDDWAFQIFTDPTPEGLMLKYNNFRKEHKVNRGQYHPVNALYTIAVWYEELKQ